MLEGGAKGLDISPDGKIIALTCRNQVLRFLDINSAVEPRGHALAFVDDRGAAATAEIALSCLVDDTPEIWASLIPWLATAIVLAKVDPKNIHIHHVCPLRPQISRLCEEVGVQTHRVDVFDALNPYTNKIIQGTREFGQVKSVILTDVDTVFTEPPPFSQMHGLVGGKPVDMPNPPLEILAEVFSKAQVETLGVCSNRYMADRVEIPFETLIGNFNGGVYIIPVDVLARLTARWIFWTRWLLGNITLLDKWWKHADQVGFNLAVSELKMPLRILDNRWNYPGHLEQPRAHATPWILHHHARLDAHGQILPVSSAVVQGLVSRVNSTIRSFRRAHHV